MHIKILALWVPFFVVISFILISVFLRLNTWHADRIEEIHILGFVDRAIEEQQKITIDRDIEIFAASKTYFQISKGKDANSIAIKAELSNDVPLNYKDDQYWIAEGTLTTGIWFVVAGNPTIRFKGTALNFDHEKILD